MTEEADAVLITGGASGIGLACAQVLAAKGRAVAIWDLDQGRSDAVAGELADTYHVAAVGLGIDVRMTDKLATEVARSSESVGPFSGLVHAAGVDGVGSLNDLSAEHWRNVMDVNLTALPFLVQAMRSDLGLASNGAVVAIASINAQLGNAMNPAYSASKAGILGLVRALADDLGHEGVRINSVSPGQILTPMLQPSLDAVEGLEENFKRRIFLGRLGQPEEVAAAVNFLLSSQASYITGQDLVVDGGNIPSQR